MKGRETRTMKLINKLCMTGVVALLLIAPPGVARAQYFTNPGFSSPAGSDVGTWYGALTYNMALPIGSLSDFTGDFSPIGIGLDARYLVRREVSIGLAFGWQAFSAETSDAVTVSNATLQGKQFRWTNVVPLLASAHYYLRDLSPVFTPFAGLNLGTYWAERRVDLGVYTAEPDSWHFGLAPEVGFGFRIRHILPIVIVRYNHIFSSGGSGDLPYFNFNVGIAWH
jgi:hypothetical protein